jgi:hypothetical protein
MEIIWFWFYFFVPQKKRRKREGSWWWWWWWWRSFGRRGPCSFLSFGYVIWTARACRSQTRGLFSNSLCCRSSFFKKLKMFFKKMFFVFHFILLFRVCFLFNDFGERWWRVCVCAQERLNTKGVIWFGN